MAVKPAAEVRVDEGLVRHLIGTQASEIAPPGTRIRQIDEGWDCTIWRVGDAYAARLPRRRAAAELTTNEHRFLHPIAERLRRAGLGSPVPVVHGMPDARYPWAWSVVPWFDGEPGLGIERHLRTGWAELLARGVAAVHQPAATGYPRNPVRGVPLADRSAAIADRLAALRASGRQEPSIVDALERAWRTGLEAPVWDHDPVWIHGDLHPGNLIAQADTLVAIIDFGDLTAGDPATDLATAWLTFDEDGRRAFHTALHVRYDPPTWTRARAWAAAMCALLLQQSDDDPHSAGLAADAAAQIKADIGDS